MANSSYALKFYAADVHNQIQSLEFKSADSGSIISNGTELAIFEKAVQFIMELLKWKVKLPGNPKVKFHPENGSDFETIIILFVKSHNLSSTEFYSNLIKAPFRYIKTMDNNDNNSVLRPVITIGSLDFFSLYEESPGMDYEAPEDIRYWREVREENKHLYRLGLDHRVKFLDSSIWHRYVPISHEFQDDFLKVLQMVVKNFERGLYESLSALATIEFQSRILHNSYIASFGQRGHHFAVTPFKFHSETVMARKVNEMLERFWMIEHQNKKSLMNLKWNFLLVDDYANREISKIIIKKPGKKNGKNLTKQAIIEELLNFSNQKSEIKNTLEFKITATQGQNKEIIDEAVHLLLNQSDTSFDIILLDYLLGDREENINVKAYGHEFLLDLCTHPQKHAFRLGPSDRFWIFSISSFPMAFADKLRQMNWENSTEQFQVSIGADPISTPEFFRLSILQFLAKQVSEYYLHEAALKRWINSFSVHSERKIWCKAIKAQIELERVKENKLAFEAKRKSAFAESMEVFLGRQTNYKKFKKELFEWLTSVEEYSDGMPDKNLYEKLLKIKGNWLARIF